MKTLRQRISGYLHTILIVLGGLSIPIYLAERCSYSNEREKFSLSLHAADAGRWYWNLETNELFWDDQMFILFGRIKEHWTPNYGGFEAAIYPEDRDRVTARVLKAIDERGGYQDIFRIVTASGEVREIRAAAMVSKDGKHMTGINLPAIHRNGNFKTGLKPRSVEAPPNSGPSPVMPDFDEATDLDRVAGRVGTGG
jgi:hypothetical protein